MPQVIAWVGATLFMTQTAVVLGSILMTYATVIGTGLLLAGAYAMSERAKRKAKAAFNASQVDRLNNVSSTVSPRELVLGRTRKAGTIVFRDSSGQHKEKFYVVVALAAHEVDGFEQVFFNDELVSLNTDGYVTSEPYAVQRRATLSTTGAAPGNAIPGSVYPSGDWDGNTSTVYQVYVTDFYARVRFYTGSSTQTADATLMAEFPGVWTSEHRLRGVAYMIVELTYNETAFPSGMPNVSVVVRGARCFDPRNGQTVFTENPALHARHILTHPYFGKRSSILPSEEAKIVAAANVCDTPHGPTFTLPGFTILGLTVPPLSITSKLYTSSIVIPYGTSTVDALDDVTQAMGGIWAYAGGEFFLKSGAYTAPVMALTAADLVTERVSSDGNTESMPVTINTHRARADKFNVVIPKIYDMQQDYKQVALDPLKNAAAIVRDGMELPQEVDFIAVGRASQARILASLMMKDQQDPLSVTANFKLKAYPIELFDNITLNLPRYGWNKVFHVMGRSQSTDGSIQLTLKETSAEIFNPAVWPNSDGYARNTDLPRPWDIHPPVISSVQSGTDLLIRQADGTITTRIRVSWTPLVDPRITQGGFVDVQWSTNGTAWSSMTVSGLDASATFSGVSDGANIVVRVRSRTTLAVSDWSLQAGHLVVGKTAPPSNVTSASVVFEAETVSLRWAAIPDLDVGGYEVRTANTGWGTGDEVFRGNTLSCPLTPNAGTWFVRAYDTTGNYSLASASASFTPATLPNATGFAHTFADTSLTAATVTLSWVDASPQFGLDGYQVTYTGGSLTVKANTVTLPANWIGNRTFTVRTVDRYGFLSSGAAYSVTKLVPGPVTNFRAQVIDNNVLLFWVLPNKTSLPVSHVLIKKGATWATATTVGTKDGGFTSISELVGGAYVYWLAVVDTDGYESAPVSLAAAVSQPPDFVFNAEYTSNLDATRSNAVTYSGEVVLPVSTTETFEQHFTTRSWTTPNAQVVAGYPLFIQPGVTTGYYEEVFDYGTLLASSSVTVSEAGTVAAGTVNKVITTSLSANGSTWTEFPGLTNVFAVNFRYVRVRVTITQNSVGSIYRLNQLTVRLDSKLKTDAGMVDALSTDASGTIVNLNTEFVDLVSITPSALGTSARTVVYDFLDSVQSGTYTLSSNIATINVTGHNLLVGQTVRLMPTTGTLVLGVYTVTQVVSANSYRVAFTAANSSGALTTYPNSFRVYVFDSSGVRQSNTVSWTVRGS